MKHDRDEEVAEERHDVGRGYDVQVSGVELESTLVNMERRVGAIEMQLQRLLETNHTLAHANKSLSRALVERKIEGLRDRNKEDDLGVRNTQVLGERNMGNLHSIEGGQQRDSGGLFSMFRSRAWSK
jgi:regulator of replication initiation timing